MIKKSITYTGIDGKSYTEDFYFHLTAAEAIELNIEHDLEMIGMFTTTGKERVEAFKHVIGYGYGRRSQDGKNFEHDPKWTRDFLSSNAYSALFVEMMQDADMLSNFIKGMLPEGANTVLAPDKPQQAQPVTIDEQTAALQNTIQQVQPQAQPQAPADIPAPVQYPSAPQYQQYPPIQ